MRSTQSTPIDYHDTDFHLPDPFGTAPECSIASILSATVTWLALAALVICADPIPTGLRSIAVMILCVCATSQIVSATQLRRRIQLGNSGAEHERIP